MLILLQNIDFRHSTHDTDRFTLPPSHLNIKSSFPRDQQGEIVPISPGYQGLILRALRIAVVLRCPNDANIAILSKKSHLLALESGVLGRGRENTVTTELDRSKNFSQGLERIEKMFHDIEVKHQIKFLTLERLGFKIFVSQTLDNRPSGCLGQKPVRTYLSLVEFFISHNVIPLDVGAAS